MLDSMPHLQVPVDFRPGSRAALQVALEMAAGLSARVTLLHVIPDEPLRGLDAIQYLHRSSGRADVPSLLAASEAALRRLGEAVHPEWRGDVPVGVSVRSGEVAAEVARYAAETAADRVVVGVNRGWRLPLWPRRSGRIAQLTCRPVVLVYPPAR